MSTETNANPKFTEQPAQLYDPSTGKVVAQKAYNVAHDTTYDIWYGDPATGSGGGGGGGAVTDLTASGTISAAQPSINTPVTSASVSLALGTGQSTFRAMLSNGGGGFTSGTTIVVDKSPDGGTTWFASSFKVSGANPDTPVSSIVGPGPLQVVGTVAGATHVKVRCSVLNSTETIAVRINASVAVSEIGIIAPLPSGPNNIGGVELIDSAGTNKLAIDGSGKIGINALPTVTEANSASINTHLANIDSDSATLVTQTAGLATQATLASAKTDLDTIASNTTGVATAANQSTGNTSLSSIATNTGHIPANGQAAMSASIPVTVASDQTPKTTSTATKTSVAASTSDTAILSSNSGRKGGKMYNDSTAICYLSEGSGAASTTSYTVQIAANGFYEIPPEPIYTGAYRAVWSAANGNLRITENS